MSPDELQLVTEILKVLGSLIQGLATIIAAVIVGVAGGLITRSFNRERAQQDRESQWRQHAIELTKLDLQRKLKLRSPNDTAPMRPSVLDFLANYRDLQELGSKTPKQMYQLIKSQRIAHTKTENQVSEEAQGEASPAPNPPAGADG